MIPSYAIGTTIENLQSIVDLRLPLPKADAVDFIEYVENGAGELVGQGWLVARWRFASLTTGEQATLAAYSGQCYVCTLEQSGDYCLYQGLMVLPPRKSPKITQLFDYVVEFRKLTVPT